MKKHNDDLKIDITELFGGDLPSPSEALEDPVVSQTVASPATSVPEPAQNDSQFQEWMKNRNQELELKAQELERRLQELQAQQQPVKPTTDALSGQDILSASAVEPAAAAITTDSTIDFNAPIGPPFMGGTIPSVSLAPSPPESTLGSGVTQEPLDPQKAEELKRLQADHEFFMLYDEFRQIIAYELKDLVGDKKTNTMLERTVELARGKYPEIFRNANWDAEGNLLENGSVDSQRIIENKNAIEPQKADIVVDAALSTLLNLRLQAVEKGLGAGLKNKVRAHLYQWINEKIQKTIREGKNPSSLRRLSSYVS
jgi:hypothetical protein